MRITHPWLTIACVLVLLATCSGDVPSEPICNLALFSNNCGFLENGVDSEWQLAISDFHVVRWEAPVLVDRAVIAINWPLTLTTVANSSLSLSCSVTGNAAEKTEHSLDVVLDAKGFTGSVSVSGDVISLTTDGVYHIEARWPAKRCNSLVVRLVAWQDPVEVRLSEVAVYPAVPSAIGPFRYFGVDSDNFPVTSLAQHAGGSAVQADWVTDPLPEQLRESVAPFYQRPGVDRAYYENTHRSAWEPVAHMAGRDAAEWTYDSIHWTKPTVFGARHPSEWQPGENAKFAAFNQVPFKTFAICPNDVANPLPVGLNITRYNCFVHTFSYVVPSFRSLFATADVSRMEDPSGSSAKYAGEQEVRLGENNWLRSAAEKPLTHLFMPMFATTEVDCACMPEDSDVVAIGTNIACGSVRMRLGICHSKRVTSCGDPAFIEALDAVATGFGAQNPAMETWQRAFYATSHSVPLTGLEFRMYVLPFEEWLVPPVRSTQSAVTPDLNPPRLAVYPEGSLPPATEDMPAERRGLRSTESFPIGQYLAGSLTSAPTSAPDISSALFGNLTTVPSDRCVTEFCDAAMFDQMDRSWYVHGVLTEVNGHPTYLRHDSDMQLSVKFLSNLSFCGARVTTAGNRDRPLYLGVRRGASAIFESEMVPWFHRDRPRLVTTAEVWHRLANRSQGLGESRGGGLTPAGSNALLNFSMVNGTVFGLTAGGQGLAETDFYVRYHAFPTLDESQLSAAGLSRRSSRSWFPFANGWATRTGHQDSDPSYFLRNHRDGRLPQWDELFLRVPRGEASVSEQFASRQRTDTLPGVGEVRLLLPHTTISGVGAVELRVQGGGYFHPKTNRFAGAFPALIRSLRFRRGHAHQYVWQTLGELRDDGVEVDVHVVGAHKASLGQAGDNERVANWVNQLGAYDALLQSGRDLFNPLTASPVNRHTHGLYFDGRSSDMGLIISFRRRPGFSNPDPGLTGLPSHQGWYGLDISAVQVSYDAATSQALNVELILRGMPECDRPDPSLRSDPDSRYACGSDGSWSVGAASGQVLHRQLVRNVLSRSPVSAATVTSSPTRQLANPFVDGPGGVEAYNESLIPLSILHNVYTNMYFDRSADLSFGVGVTEGRDGWGRDQITPPAGGRALWFHRLPLERYFPAVPPATPNKTVMEVDYSWLRERLFVVRATVSAGRLTRNQAHEACGFFGAGVAEKAHLLAAAVKQDFSYCQPSWALHEGVMELYVAWTNATSARAGTGCGMNRGEPVVRPTLSNTTGRSWYQMQGDVFCFHYEPVTCDILDLPVLHVNDSAAPSVAAAIAAEQAGYHAGLEGMHQHENPAEPRHQGISTGRFCTVEGGFRRPALHFAEIGTPNQTQMRRAASGAPGPLRTREEHYYDVYQRSANLSSLDYGAVVAGGQGRGVLAQDGNYFHARGVCQTQAGMQMCSSSEALLWVEWHQRAGQLTARARRRSLWTGEGCTLRSGQRGRVALVLGSMNGTGLQSLPALHDLTAQLYVVGQHESWFSQAYRFARVCLPVSSSAGVLCCQRRTQRRHVHILSQSMGTDTSPEAGAGQEYAMVSMQHMSWVRYFLRNDTVLWMDFTTVARPFLRQAHPVDPQLVLLPPGGYEKISMERMLASTPIGMYSLTVAVPGSKENFFNLRTLLYAGSAPPLWSQHPGGFMFIDRSGIPNKFAYVMVGESGIVAPGATFLQYTLGGVELIDHGCYQGTGIGCTRMWNDATRVPFSFPFETGLVGEISAPSVLITQSAVPGARTLFSGIMGVPGGDYIPHVHSIMWRWLEGSCVRCAYSISKRYADSDSAGVFTDSFLRGPRAITVSMLGTEQYHVELPSLPSRPFVPFLNEFEVMELLSTDVAIGGFRQPTFEFLSYDDPNGRSGALERIVMYHNGHTRNLLKLPGVRLCTIYNTDDTVNDGDFAECAPHAELMARMYDNDLETYFDMSEVRGLAHSVHMHFDYPVYALDAVFFISAALYVLPHEYSFLNGRVRSVMYCTSTPTFLYRCRVAGTGENDVLVAAPATTVVSFGRDSKPNGFFHMHEGAVFGCYADNPCFDPACQVCSGHGECSDLDYWPGSNDSLPVCMCDPGYTGVRCEILGVGDSRAACGNGSLSYFAGCVCPQGFAGKSCQQCAEGFEGYPNCVPATSPAYYAGCECGRCPPGCASCSDALLLCRFPETSDTPEHPLVPPCPEGYLSRGDAQGRVCERQQCPGRCSACKPGFALQSASLAQSPWNGSSHYTGDLVCVPVEWCGPHGVSSQSAGCVCMDNFYGDSCQLDGSAHCNFRGSVDAWTQHSASCQCDAGYDAAENCGDCQREGAVYVRIADPLEALGFRCEPCDLCGEHGTCKRLLNSSILVNGQVHPGVFCECMYPHDGEFCRQCVNVSWIYPVGGQCVECRANVTCNDRGSCNSTAQCECHGGFAGQHCDQCQPGYWGPTCRTCPVDENGVICNGQPCDDGIDGTGECLCPPGTASPSCDDPHFAAVTVMPASPERIGTAGGTAMVVQCEYCNALLFLSAWEASPSFAFRTKISRSTLEIACIGANLLDLPDHRCIRFEAPEGAGLLRVELVVQRTDKDGGHRTVVGLSDMFVAYRAPEISGFLGGVVPPLYTGSNYTIVGKDFGPSSLPLTCQVSMSFAAAGGSVSYQQDVLFHNHTHAILRSHGTFPGARGLLVCSDEGHHSPTFSIFYRQVPVDQIRMITAGYEHLPGFNISRVNPQVTVSQNRYHIPGPVDRLVLSVPLGGFNDSGSILMELFTPGSLAVIPCDYYLAPQAEGNLTVSCDVTSVVRFDSAFKLVFQHTQITTAVIVRTPLLFELESLVPSIHQLLPCNTTVECPQFSAGGLNLTVVGRNFRRRLPTVRVRSNSGELVFPVVRTVSAAEVPEGLDAVQFPLPDGRGRNIPVEVYDGFDNFGTLTYSYAGPKIFPNTLRVVGHPELTMNASEVAAAGYNSSFRHTHFPQQLGSYNVSFRGSALAGVGTTLFVKFGPALPAVSGSVDLELASFEICEPVYANATHVTCTLEGGVGKLLRLQVELVETATSRVFSSPIAAAGGDTLSFGSPTVTNETLRFFPNALPGTSVLFGNASVGDRITLDGTQLGLSPVDRLVTLGSRDDPLRVLCDRLSVDSAPLFSADSVSCRLRRGQGKDLRITVWVAPGVGLASPNSLTHPLLQYAYRVSSFNSYSFPTIPVVTRVAGCVLPSANATNTVDCPTDGTDGTQLVDGVQQRVALTIIGQHFQSFGLLVRVGERSCADPTLAAPGEIHCWLPEGSGVLQAVQVQNPGGEQSTPAALVSYRAPTIVSIDMAGCKVDSGTGSLFDCPRDGGQLVITGTDFGPSDALVIVGSKACEPLTHSTLRPHREVSCNISAGIRANDPVLLIQNGGSLASGGLTFSYEPCEPGFRADTGAELCLPCPNGTSSAFPQSLFCSPCELGLFAAGPPGSLVECTACPAGRFQNDSGASACHLCAHGTFQAQVGFTSCSQCPMGSFQAEPGSAVCNSCRLGQFGNATGQSVCWDCPAGRFGATLQLSVCADCPVGRLAPQAGTVQCSDTPLATFVNETGQTAPTDCPMGRFASIAGLSSCYECPAGAFNNRTGRSACQACPTNHFSAAPGASYCAECPIGTDTREISPEVEPVGASTCQDCLPGTYRRQGNRTCVSCAPGHFAASSSATACQRCAPGRAQLTSGQAGCDLCALGTYAALPAQTSCDPSIRGFVPNSNRTGLVGCLAGRYGPTARLDRCVNCQGGRYSASVSLTACLDCPAGRRATESGSTACQDCQNGTFSVTGASACTDCPPGSYSGSGFASCQLAPAGRFAALSRSTDSTPCPAGTHNTQPGQTVCRLCVAGRFVAVSGREECDPCPAGSFSATQGSSACRECPVGRAQLVPGCTGCPVCPAGRHQNSTGNRVCHQCVAGRYADGSAELASECAGCRVGTFISGAAASSCFACPRGFFSQAEGSEECQACPAGSFMEATGRTACQACDVGRFAASSSSTTCALCGLGRFNNATNQTSCVPCATGRFADKTAQLSCLSCPLGKAQRLAGQQECLPCLTGHDANRTGMTSCASCRRGRFAAVIGTPECLACPPGRQGGNVQATGCALCGAGRFANHTNGAASCRACQSGRYQPSTGEHSACLLCEPGTFQAGTAQSSCIKCTAGSYAPFNGSRACIPCAVGKAQSREGAAECEVCPAGKVTSSQTAVFTECVACAKGRYQALPEQGSCVNCPLGTYLEETGGSECLQCGRGRFAPANGTEVCQKCIANYISPGLGFSRCHSCGPNAESNTQRDTCECAVGYMFYDSEQNNSNIPTELSGSCVVCPVGADCSSRGTRFSRVHARYGFWRPDNESTEFFQCLANDHCPGGLAASCEDHRTGPLCALCEDGYKSRTGTSDCEACPEQGLNVLAAGGFVLLIGLGLTVLMFLVLKSEYYLDKYLAESESFRVRSAIYERYQIAQQQSSRGGRGNRRRGRGGPVPSVDAQAGTDSGPAGRSDEKWAGDGAGSSGGRHDALGSALANSLRRSMHVRRRNAQTAAGSIKTTGAMATGDDAVNAGVMVESRDEALLESLGLQPGQVYSEAELQRSIRVLRTLLHRARPNFSYKMKIIIGFFQITTNLPFILDLDYPRTYTEFMKVFSFVNLDFMPWQTFGCLGVFDYYSKMIVTLCIPPVIMLGVVLLYFWPSKCLLNRRLGGTPSEYQVRMVDFERKRLKRKAWKMCIFIVFLLLPRVSSTVFRFFVCREVLGTSYLKEDFNLVCFDDYWVKYLPVALLGLLLYPVCIPAAIGVVLYRYRFRLESALVRLQFGLLYESFNGDSFWFEMLDILHKIVLTSLVGFFADHIQVEIAVMVAFAYLAVLLVREPYVRRDDNLLHLLAQVQILNLFVLALVIREMDAGDTLSGRTDLALSLILIATALSFLFLGVVLCFKSVYRMLRVCKHRVDACCGSCVNACACCGLVLRALCCGYDPHRGFGRKRGPQSNFRRFVGKHVARGGAGEARLKPLSLLELQQAMYSKDAGVWGLGCGNAAVAVAAMGGKSRAARTPQPATPSVPSHSDEKDAGRRSVSPDDPVNTRHGIPLSLMDWRQDENFERMRAVTGRFGGESMGARSSDLLSSELMVRDGGSEDDTEEFLDLESPGDGFRRVWSGDRL